MPPLVSVLACVLLAGVPLLSAAEVATGKPAKTLTTHNVPSASLGAERQVNVLLPADYETSTRRYPVLYLLHGLGDNHTAWSYMTNLSGYAAKQPVIVVMPDVGRSFYVNSAADTKARYEDFIVKDLVTYVDSTFRTIPLPRARAVAGLSMGGYGAMLIGLKHYKRFSAIGSFSGVIGMATDAAATASTPSRPLRPELQAMFGAIGSPDRAERDPFRLLEKVPMADMPLLYIACGGQDFLVEQNRAFTKLLAEKKVPYEYHEVSPRGHTWDFWDDQVRVFLELLAKQPSWAE